MRLIDADELTEKLNECFYDTTNPEARRAAHDTMALCQSLVDEQPTAYDIDRVVERLEEKAIEELGIDKARFAMDRGEYSCYCSLCLSGAIEIVKSGGIEQKLNQ